MEIEVRKGGTLKVGREEGGLGSVAVASEGGGTVLLGASAADSMV